MAREGKRMARNIRKSLKIDPTQYLTDSEKYLQHFWKPKIGHHVVYEKEIYTIKSIENNQVSLNECNKLLWFPDLGWKPTISDCDDVATRFNAQVTPDQIIYRNGNKRSIFLKPKTLDEYTDIIRQIRVFNSFTEMSN